MTGENIINSNNNIEENNINIMTGENIINSNNNIEIKNLDLYSNQYCENILIYNINKLSPHSILTTQNNLSNHFIWNYILNTKYAIFREDNDITLQEILKYYPNFKKTNIVK